MKDGMMSKKAVGMHKMPDGKMMKDSDMKKMACGGKTTKMARGGGIEKTGKTDGKMVKMAKGGSVSKRADGIASRGKTSCKVM